MRLDDLDPTSNARDLGQGGGGFGGGGGLGGGGLLNILFGLLPMLLGRRLGCGAIALIAIVGFFLMNSSMFTSAPSAPTQAEINAGQASAGANQACDTQAELFACQVMTSTEQTWSKIFADQGAQYPAPTLNFYSRNTVSGCGAAQSAMGPFYCPADSGVYIDTDFFAELSQRFGVGGASNFARAYVIAHEVGHHVQNVTGRAEQVRRAQARASQAQQNALQVRMELEADCYAGVWAARNAERMEPGDVEQGLRAAHAIGDDTMMARAGQRPIESMFTHGTSEQRMAWLRRGMETGDPAQCDAFKADF